MARPRSARGSRPRPSLPEPAGLTELADTGHMSPLERPREVAEALQGLVRETAGAAVTTADGR